eukprot:Gb_09137 [translate_table: standard]
MTGNRKRWFKKYYLRWIKTLKKQAGQLKDAMQKPHDLDCASRLQLHARVERLRRHFESYYDAMDAITKQDVLQVLSPSWRSTLEKPYLWIGDWHPALFINLFYALLGHQHSTENNARRYAPDDIFKKIEKIEKVLGTMVPALFHRLRTVQLSLGTSIAKDWLQVRNRPEASQEDRMAVFQGAVGAQLRDLTGIFVDANCLRRNIVCEILNASDVYQAGQYLQGLAQFQLSLRDPELARALQQFKLFF